MSTYDGLAVPLNGESQITQITAATDILTITGASSQSGDFIVCENSTGAELFYVDSTGAMTSAAGLAISGSITGTQQTLVVSATTMTAGLLVSVTSTGALATDETAVNGVLVSASSKSVLNAAFGYTSGAGSEVGSCNHLLMADGSKAPTYFLGVSASVGPGLGAIVANGFLDDSLLLNTFTCDHPFVGLKCIAGSVAFYLLGAQATGIT